MPYLIIGISVALMYFFLNPKEPPVTLNGYVALLLIFVGLFTIYRWQLAIGILLVGYLLPIAVWGVKVYFTKEKEAKERENFYKANGIEKYGYKDALPKKHHTLSYFDKEYTEKYKDYENLPTKYKEFLVGVDESIVSYYGKIISEGAYVLREMDCCRKQNRTAFEKTVNDEKLLATFIERAKKHEADALILRKSLYLKNT